MTWIFDRGTVAANRHTRAQHEFLVANRRMHEASERAFSGIPLEGINASAPVPYPVYAEFDQQTKRITQDETGDLLLNDLLPISRSIDIGKIVHQYRQAGDGGAVTTSLSGLEPIANDQVSYKHDGAIIPVHQSGFYREWRELAGQRSEGFDGLIDDQAASVRAVRTRMVDYILDGQPGLQFAGIPSYGIRNGTNTVKGEIAVDLTSAATTGVQFRNEFMRLRDILRINNRVTQPLTVYISPEIAANLDHFYTNEGPLASSTIRQQLLALEGIAAIKTTSRLSGNEIIMGVLSQEFIVPLTAQAVGTVALPRPQPFARHQFLTWSAMGLEIRADYDGRSGWAYFSRP